MPDGKKRDKEKDTIKCQYFTTKRILIAVTKRKKKCEENNVLCMEH